MQDRILPPHAVFALVGRSATTIYARTRAGTFPRPFRLPGANRAIGWLEADITAWLAAQQTKPSTEG